MANAFDGGPPTIDEPKLTAECCVHGSMRVLCKVRGKALDGTVARVVYAELYTSDPGPIPNPYQPDTMGLARCEPSALDATYNLDFRLFTSIEGNANKRWIRVIAEYPPEPGKMWPPRYYPSQLDAFEVKYCDNCQESRLTPASLSRPLLLDGEDELGAMKSRVGGWRDFPNLSVKQYAAGGTAILPAESPEQVALHGTAREFAVYAKDVAWQYDHAIPTSAIYSPAGNGIAAPPYFFVPGAPQYSVILWQPKTHDHAAIFHVITATRRIDAQVLVFDRRLPVFAQVNDYAGDGYATNVGGFGLSVKLL